MNSHKINMVEDPWVKQYNSLINKLVSIGMPITFLSVENPNWNKIKNKVKHYCKGKEYQKIIILFKQVHNL